MPDAGQPEFSVLEQAAEWYAVLRSGAVSADERLAWERWLVAAPAHREAWRRVEQVTAQFNALPGAPAREALIGGGGGGVRARRRNLKALALLCLGGALGATLAGRDEGRAYLAGLHADFHTDTGVTAALPLEDGSAAWLNTASAADVAYTGTLRRIVLRRGELLIHTAHDTRQPARPLVVDVAHGRMLALGTRFSARLTPEGTQLAVYEGAVQVDAAGRGGRRVVPAGYQLRFDEDRIGAPTRANEDAAAWSRNLLIATQMRLDDFLAELGRYRHGYLGCDPAVAGLHLVGSYPLDDTDQTLTMLEAALPVRVRRTLPWWVSVAPR